MGSKSTRVLYQQGYDYPFDHTKPLFKDSSIILANLEGPLTDTGTPTPDKKYVYKSPANQVIQALKNAGINAVTLANNHIMDYGDEGLNNTIQALDAAHIAHVGAGSNLAQARKPALFNIDGITVGLLGYSLTFPESYWATDEIAGTAFGQEEEIRADIKALRARTDAIIVSFHWGRELQTELRPYQARLAHLAIDNGATAVIGHHPHIMQGVEAYKNGIIFYSLGNYVFGSYSNNVQYGGLANLQIDNHGIQSMQLNILDINNFRRDFQPTPMTGTRLEKSIQEIITLSEQLGTKLTREENKVIFNR